MIVIPAIDLQRGQCVRLTRGDPATADVFNRDPTAQARTFEMAGCQRIHVVDLDGAFAGHPANIAAVEGIVRQSGLPVQLGGGIRNLATVDFWLDRGIDRIILGTAAAENHELVASAARKHPGRIIAGIDARNGLVATRGWVETTEQQANDLAARLQDLGISAIVFTDIGRDGMMRGPNLDAVAEIAASVEIPVIASGGVSSIDDLRKLSSLDAGLEGVIVGRAIYDGSVDLAAAAAEFSGTGSDR